MLEERCLRRAGRYVPISGLCIAFAASVAFAEDATPRGQGPANGPRSSTAPGVSAPARVTKPIRCPSEMVKVRGFCIDRWEISTVDRETKQSLSPFYPPDPKTLGLAHDVWERDRGSTGPESARGMPLPKLPEIQRGGNFAPLAVSRPSVVPQGYLSYYAAERACSNAGKRLCKQSEWVTACKGEKARKFPYAETYQLGQCNVFRPYHPAAILHDNSSVGHRDPRLNLVSEGANNPLLRLTGSTPTCASNWEGDRIYDMVGNLDEWVVAEKGSDDAKTSSPAPSSKASAAQSKRSKRAGVKSGHGKSSQVGRAEAEAEREPTGVFVGGFYARSTTNGCESEVTSHALSYYDYSLGARCCLDPN
jgi:formylglycine-generating enzyme